MRKSVAHAKHSSALNLIALRANPDHHPLIQANSTMLGFVSWLACGLIAGMIVNKLISGFDKGIVFITLCVGVAGAMAGGVGASFFGYGDLATFSMYAVVCAVIGSVVTLASFSRFVEY